jgi:hypothetical protein
LLYWRCRGGILRPGFYRFRHNFRSRRYQNRPTGGSIARFASTLIRHRRCGRLNRLLRLNRPQAPQSIAWSKPAARPEMTSGTELPAASEACDQEHGGTFCKGRRRR